MEVVLKLSLSDFRTCELIHNVRWLKSIEFASLVAQMVKSLPVVQETQEESLGKEMATHPSVLPWKIPWTGEHVAESDRTERLHFLLSIEGFFWASHVNFHNDPWRSDLLLSPFYR